MPIGPIPLREGTRRSLCLTRGGRGKGTWRITPNRPLGFLHRIVGRCDGNPFVPETADSTPWLVSLFVVSLREVGFLMEVGRMSDCPA